MAWYDKITGSKLWNNSLNFSNPLGTLSNFGILPDKGGDAEIPGPSQQEQDLWDAQLEELTSNRKRQNEVDEITMGEKHYKKEYSADKQKLLDAKDAYDNFSGSKYDENGNITKEWADVANVYQEQIAQVMNKGQHNVSFEDIENGTWNKKIEDAQVNWDVDYRKMSDDEWYNDPNTTDSEREEWDIATKQRERTKAALEGTLPLSESLLDQKQKEFDQLKETYGITGDTLENATGQDTIGIQNLDTFKKRWAQLEDAQRYGESTSSLEGSVLANSLTGDLSANTIGSNYNQNYATNMTGYQSLLAPLQMYRQAGYQAQAANAANRNSQYSSLLGLGAMGLMALSSKKFKKDIHPKSKADENKALKDITKTKSYDYRYKPMMGMGSLKHTGTIAEESPRSFSNGTVINLGDKMETMAMAIKALERKVARK